MQAYPIPIALTKSALTDTAGGNGFLVGTQQNVLSVIGY